MSRWLARLGVKSQERVTAPTAKTDRTPMEAPDKALLSVLSVPKEGHTQKTRTASNDEAGGGRLIKGNPYLSREAADRCHTPAWSDAEIFALTTRAVKFVRIGLRHDADNLAELLTLRDRDNDDRRLCVECRYGRSARCPDGLPMPLSTLHRCGGFTKDTI